MLQHISPPNLAHKLPRSSQVALIYIFAGADDAGTYLCRVLVDHEGQAPLELACIALSRPEPVQGLYGF